MTNAPKPKGRPPGPPKERVTIYLLKTTVEKCRLRKQDTESLPGYIARNFERVANRNTSGSAKILPLGQIGEQGPELVSPPKGKKLKP